MLDQIEYKISKDLAERHLYPFAQNIYMDIFKAFSYFPLNLDDLKLEGPGKTITYLALVVKRCSESRGDNFLNLYHNILEQLRPLSDIMIQDIVVETYLGCMLFYYHPALLRNALSKHNSVRFFNEKELYEFELKRKTILIFAV